jgi:hypothetical protein
MAPIQRLRGRSSWDQRSFACKFALRIPCFHRGIGSHFTQGDGSQREQLRWSAPRVKFFRYWTEDPARAGCAGSASGRDLLDYRRSVSDTRPLLSTPTAGRSSSNGRRASGMTLPGRAAAAALPAAVPACEAVVPPHGRPAATQQHATDQDRGRKRVADQNRGRQRVADHYRGRRGSPVSVRRAPIGQKRRRQGRLCPPSWRA